MYELASLIAELDSAGHVPPSEEWLYLWDASLSFYSGRFAPALQTMQDHLTWRSSPPFLGVRDVDSIPLQLLSRELSSGTMFVGGNDRGGRALVVVNVASHTSSTPWYDRRRLSCATVWLVEQARLL